MQWAEEAPIQISIAPGRTSLRKEKQKWAAKLSDHLPCWKAFYNAAGRQTHWPAIQKELFPVLKERGNFGKNKLHKKGI